MHKTRLFTEGQTVQCGQLLQKEKNCPLPIYFLYDRPRPLWGAEMSLCFHLCKLNVGKSQDPPPSETSVKWITFPYAVLLPAREINMGLIFISGVRQRVQRFLGYQPHKQCNDSRDSCPLNIMTLRPHKSGLSHCVTWLLHCPTWTFNHQPRNSEGSHGGLCPCRNVPVHFISRTQCWFVSCESSPWKQMCCSANTYLTDFTDAFWK